MTRRRVRAKISFGAAGRQFFRKDRLQDWSDH
jgi:hypothetical protein